MAWDCPRAWRSTSPQAISAKLSFGFQKPPSASRASEHRPLSQAHWGSSGVPSLEATAASGGQCRGSVGDAAAKSRGELALIQRLSSELSFSLGIHDWRGWWVAEATGPSPGRGVQDQRPHEPCALWAGAWLRSDQQGMKCSQPKA